MLPRLKVLLLSFSCTLLVSVSVLAHDRHVDPRLAELNDYLMALQVLRHRRPQADSLFLRWRDLRTASWKIRELTDEQDLSIEAPEVVDQIQRTRRLQEALLSDCRAYFRELANVLPTIRIRIGDNLDVAWDDPNITAPVGSRRVVLIEMLSDRSGPTHLHLSDSRSEQILFWSKPVTVNGDQARYTFVYVSPYEPGPTQASISVDWHEHRTATIPIHADGTLPATYDWYNHRPASSLYNIDHEADPSIQEHASKAGFREDQRIKFRIRDHETGQPLPVRVEVSDADGNAYWTPLRGPSYAVNREDIGSETPLWTFQQGPYFYIDGDAELGVDPQGKTVRMYHGFEYEPVVAAVPDDGVVEAAPGRWIDMAAKGWYSGHTHIHTTDAGLPVHLSVISCDDLVRPSGGETMSPGVEALQSGTERFRSGAAVFGKARLDKPTKEWCEEAGFINYGQCIEWARRAEILLVEHFNDTDFASRGWYSVRSGATVLSTEDSAPGTNSALECRYLEGARNCPNGTPARAEIPETESVYMSYWVRYSTNWVGSGRTNHPHEFHFLTNKDDRWVGPARSHLTMYIEQTGLTPKISLQDSRNVDENCILRGNDVVVGCDGDFDSYQFTEARSVASCNGLHGYLDPIQVRNGRDCYNAGSYWYSARHWSGTEGQAFTPGEWHFVEVLLSMNDIVDGKGVANGSIRHWVDSELMFTSDNILFRTGENSDMAFKYFMFAPYIGVGSPIEQVMWIDEITIVEGMS